MIPNWFIDLDCIILLKSSRSTQINFVISLQNSETSPEICLSVIISCIFLIGIPIGNTIDCLATPIGYLDLHFSRPIFCIPISETLLSDLILRTICSFRIHWIMRLMWVVIATMCYWLLGFMLLIFNFHVMVLFKEFYVLMILSDGTRSSELV